MTSPTILTRPERAGRHEDIFLEKRDCRRKDNRLQDTKSGICVTCIHAMTCIYRKSNIQPVVHCEEFETESCLQKETKHNTPKIIAESQYQGLCFNCENRETCIYTQTEGGIWHCEEYR